MAGNKSPNVIDGDCLKPNQRYLMKVWRKRNPNPFRYTKSIIFIAYCNSNGIFTKDDFDMKDLHPGDTRSCILVDEYGHVIVLKATTDKVWTTDDDDRVTFDTLPATATP